MRLASKAAPSLTDTRVANARGALVLDDPFFGVLALQLQLVNDPSCQTAWTDGKSLGYNPSFIDQQTDAQLRGLLCHEVMHCALGHPWRRDGREPRQWNRACDYPINGLILQAGLQLPDGALLSSEYTGKCAEWVYDRLAPSGDSSAPEPGLSKPSGGDEDGDEPGSSGGDEPGDSPDSGVPGDEPGGGDSQPGEVRDAPQDADAPTEQDWAQTVEQAARICQGQGSMPGGLSSALAAAKAPAVDWRAALRRYMQDVCAADYSWARPNVRYMAQGLYLPSLRAERCGRIVVAVDTSGSVDDVLLAQFGAELQSIVDEVKPVGVTVLYCDTQINHEDEYGPDEPITLARHGGGGTCFAPVFDHVAAADDAAPAVLVYLTDLDGSMPDVAPDYPVIWAVTGYLRDSAVPFGDVVALD